MYRNLPDPCSWSFHDRLSPSLFNLFSSHYSLGPRVILVDSLYGNLPYGNPHCIPSYSDSKYHIQMISSCIGPSAGFMLDEESQLLFLRCQNTFTTKVPKFFHLCWISLTSLNILASELGSAVEHLPCMSKDLIWFWALPSPTLSNTLWSGLLWDLCGACFLCLGFFFLNVCTVSQTSLRYWSWMDSLSQGSILGPPGKLLCLHLCC